MQRDPYVTLMGHLGQTGTGPGGEGLPLPPLPPVAKKHLPYGGWPAPAVARASQWSTATGHVYYVLHSGDTLSGLAKTYLGSYPRWTEIRDLNFPHAGWTPDSVPVGGHLTMPPDAIENAKSRGFVPRTYSAKTGKSLAPRYLLIGGIIAGTVVVGGGAVYLATR